MSRAPFQILVLPWRTGRAGTPEFLILRRADDGAWQGIAGGGEDTETPLDSAKREASEEAGIPPDADWTPLQATASIPVVNVQESESWEEDLYVVPEHAFGVHLQEAEILLSSEHVDMHWLEYEDAYALLRYESNRIALWELNRRIRHLGPRDPTP